jgi:putative hemolysin
MNSIAEARRPGNLALPVATSTDYVARLARDADEVRAAQRLRFQVFNLELGEGLDSSYPTGLDQDPFDAACDHLLVFHAASGDLAGTYRLQTGTAALAGLGYYSEREFDFGVFESLRTEMIELGRACVDADHRNLAVLGLLWKGIASYARQRRARYLVGCSSIPTMAPEAGWAVYERLSTTHSAPPERRTLPRPGWECGASVRPGESAAVPKLMQAYLSLGAVICAPPALDREFGTIDFLTLMDIEAIHPAARRRFFG